MESKYSELKIYTDQSNLELLSTALVMLNIQGIVNLSDDMGVAIYLPTAELNNHWEDKLIKILTQFGIKRSDYQFQQTDNIDLDWGKEWKPYYHKTQISHFMAIVPRWQKQEVKSQYDILMDPEESFGSGEHTTTKLCLQALEQVITDQQSLIDVGTGTGILAIAARKFGVKQIYACDIDAPSVKNAQDNIEYNVGLQNVTLAVNSLLTDVKQTADLITANMLEAPITQLIPQLPAHLNQNGLVIISGILNKSVARITDQLNKQNIKVIHIALENDWACLIAQKENQ